MIRNCLYRHPNNSTVAFEIVKSFYVKEKDVYKIKVAWWNIGKCHKPCPMQITQRITISSAKLKEFEIMDFGETLDKSEFDRLCTNYPIAAGV